MKTKFQTGNALYSNWENGILELANSRLRKWNFRTKEEESKRLIEKLEKEYEEFNRSQYREYPTVCSCGLWSREDIALIEEYATSVPW